MKRRIFIAINLPPKTKDWLVQFQDQYCELPVRWTKAENLHLTLTFIGYVTDEQMLEICAVARQAVSEVEPFFIQFKKITLGPPGKPPRLIWLEGQPSPALAELKSRLEKLLLEGETGFAKAEVRAFSPHITLARINMEQWRNLPQKPTINEAFEAQIPVNSIEVMESDLRRGGAEYTILESCPLGN